MAFIEWSDRISIGHPVIDRDHRRLVELVNRMHEAMGQGLGTAALGGVLRELIAYTRTHFGHEEVLMRDHAYPHFREHKKMHEELLAQVTAFEEKFSAGTVLLSLEVMNFLRQWLTIHIMDHDKALASFLDKGGPAA